MLLSEIGDKEIIDVSTGSRFGELWDAEILFDETNGRICALVLPIPQKGIKWGRAADTTTLPWNSIIKISDSLILFESENK